MTLPASGELKLSEVIAEYQKPGADSLRDFLRDDIYVFDAAIPASGELTLRDFLGTGAQQTLANAGTIENQNLYSIYVAAFGTPSAAVNFVYTNNGTIGATPGNWALVLGDFPSGSTVELVNNGSIQGAGGAASSGGAGGCIYAISATTYTKKITNNANIWAGGGGGGNGGAGGSGYYAYNLGTSNESEGNCHESCETEFGSGAYCSHNQTGGCICWSGRTCYRNYSSTGGAGGTGGRGQGYDGAAASGTAGASGGSGAGAGGTGGTGGGWGATGATGNTGASGNVGGGTGGTAGGGPGSYIYGNSLITWLATGSRLGTVV